jgi:hypothetical protein
MPRRKVSRRLAITALLWVLTAVLGIVLPIAVRDTSGQIAVDNAGIDAAMAQLRQRANYPGFEPSLLSAAGRNLLNLAQRWPTLGGRPSANSQPFASSRPSDSRSAQFPANLAHSKYSGFTQSGTSTAWCGRNVVVAFNDTSAEVATMASGRGISADGYAVSRDRGGSFIYMGPPTTPNDPNTLMNGDPVVACSSRGRFYLASTWLDGTNGISGVSLSISSNGGRTFSTPAVVVGKPLATHLTDRPWIAVDPNTRNRIYIIYTDLDFSGSLCGTVDGSPVPRYAIEAVSSSDGGATWSAPPVVIDETCADASHASSFLNGAQLAVGPGGIVYAAWEAFGINGSLGGRNVAPADPDRAIRFAKSLDQGASFSTPLAVTPVNCAGDCTDWQGLFHSNEYPSLAIGKGPYNQGKIYLAWNDGDRQVADSLSPSGSYNFTDILFIRSADGGLAWSKPKRVNNNREGSGAPLTDQFEPALATDASGRIAVCFYDRRRNPKNFRIDRYCASSQFGGSWTNTRITAQNFPVIIGQDILVAPDYMGDYDTLASDFSNHRLGFIGAFATNQPGNPSVRLNTY